MAEKDESNPKSDLMSRFTKRLRDSYDKDKISKYIIAHETSKKIPFIRFSTISEVDSKNIQLLEGLLLEYAMLHNNSNECAVIYRLDRPHHHISDRVSIVKGTIDSVKVGDDRLIESANDVVVVTMHNHPNCSPLSIEDLAFFMETECVRLLTAVGNNGRVEAIEKTSSYDVEVTSQYFMSLLTSEGGVPEGYLKYITDDDIRNLNSEIKLRITRSWIEHQRVAQRISYRSREEGSLYESVHQNKRKFSKDHWRNMGRNLGGGGR